MKARFRNHAGIGFRSVARPNPQTLSPIYPYISPLIIFLITTKMVHVIVGNRIELIDAMPEFLLARCLPLVSWESRNGKEDGNHIIMGYIGFRL